MNTPHRLLLTADAVINLILGVLLLLFPAGIASWLGVPAESAAFYPVILGGVLFGIGLALLLEAFGGKRGIRGLGIAGAIVINFCGAGVLGICLVAAPPAIPLRGTILLWSIVIVVLMTALIELLTGSGRA